MRLSAAMSAGLAPGEIIMAIGIARHDAQQHEHDDGDASERDERHGQRLARIAINIERSIETDRVDGRRAPGAAADRLDVRYLGLATTSVRLQGARTRSGVTLRSAL